MAHLTAWVVKAFFYHQNSVSLTLMLARVIDIDITMKLDLGLVLTGNHYPDVERYHGFAVEIMYSEKR